MKINMAGLLVAGSLVLASCDPGLTGDLRVYNHSDSVITVVVKKYNTNITYTILPDSNKAVGTVGGLGDKRTFDCCPCEADTIYITTSSGVIKKDASGSEHWTIPNKSKLRRFGEEGIKCELHIMPSDI